MSDFEAARAFTDHYPDDIFVDRDPAGRFRVVDLDGGRRRESHVHPLWHGDGEPNVAISVGYIPGPDDLPNSDLRSVGVVEIPVDNLTPVVTGEIADVDGLLRTAGTGLDLFIGWLSLPDSVRNSVPPHRVSDNLLDPREAGRVLREGGLDSANAAMIEKVVRKSYVDMHPYERLLFMKRVLGLAISQPQP